MHPLSMSRVLLWMWQLLLLLLLPVHLLHVQHLEDGLALPMVERAGPLRLHDAHRKRAPVTAQCMRVSERH